ncbi:MAG: hypothetical protein Edafosvirus11_13 [Edafosvirus sp.]|uniref:Uncharacterized protein n=1 Tax=Edafosvirus sp. TaxID=2487765 RepID=A0A3G4ZU00_9VIRU|nr:MAG: hypothetical protein Edafosvirus11_13 [Edafosvirus sp.]
MPTNILIENATAVNSIGVNFFDANGNANSDFSNDNGPDHIITSAEGSQLFTQNQNALVSYPLLVRLYWLATDNTPFAKALKIIQVKIFSAEDFAIVLKQNLDYTIKSKKRVQVTASVQPFIVINKTNRPVAVVFDVNSDDPSQVPDDFVLRIGADKIETRTIRKNFNSPLFVRIQFPDIMQEFTKEITADTATITINCCVRRVQLSTQLYPTIIFGPEPNRSPPGEFTPLRPCDIISTDPCCGTRSGLRFNLVGEDVLDTENDFAIVEQDGAEIEEENSEDDL